MTSLRFPISSTAASSSEKRSSSPSPPPTIHNPHSPTSYLTYPVSHVVTGLYRRLTAPSPSSPLPPQSQNMTSLYQAPIRTHSPFNPPPLTPLTLRGILPSTSPRAQILSRALAEEIRLLVPPRLQLLSDWFLAYSIEQDGVSLSTLYSKCAEYGGRQHGFVLVVRDALGGIFGAFLTDAPHPSPHYYGTGECFLWRATTLPPSASLLASLPPPPSSDTTNLQRSTTIGARPSNFPKDLLSPWQAPNPSTQNTFPPSPAPSTGTSTPERLRFKAFPYSGVNDYMIFCEHDFLSVGGGDGRYGLWLDRVLERGVSARCLTFGNEGLSEEGERFEVLGVEVWYLGS